MRRRDGDCEGEKRAVEAEPAAREGEWEGRLGLRAGPLIYAPSPNGPIQWSRGADRTAAEQGRGGMGG